MIIELKFKLSVQLQYMYYLYVFESIPIFIPCHVKYQDQNHRRGKGGGTDYTQHITTWPPPRIFRPAAGPAY